MKEDNILKKPFKFLSAWRPLPSYELVGYILMYASVPMLAYGIKPYNSDIIKIIVLTVLTMYSGFFAALIWNDITDREIDAVAHPDRPVPSGRISPKMFFAIALIFSAMTFIFALSVSLWCLALVGIAALFVAFHDKYLKKIVKIPAYSEIFTPIQWVVVAIFGFLAIWTTFQQSGDINLAMPVSGYISLNIYDFQNMILLVLFTYFIDNAHDLPEGIHDVDGDRKLGVRTYATSFGEKTAAKISFAMFFISGSIGIVLWFRTLLSLIFLVPFLFLWLYTLYNSYKFIRINDDFQRRQQGKIMGKKGYDFFLFSYTLIFLDVLIQLLNAFYLHWTNVII